MGYTLSPHRNFCPRGFDRAGPRDDIIRHLILLASILGLLTGCRSQSNTLSALPEEIHLSPVSSVAGITATPAVPTAVMVEGTPTPVGSMRRTSPASLPPQRIVAPEIDLGAPVVPMAWQNIERDGLRTTEWMVPDGAAGYQIGSAFPGQEGNTVLVGHHNVKGRVFENLRHLAPGDSVYLYTAEDEFHYVVTDSFMLRELGASPEERYQNAQWIGPTADERLTLVTCWPPTGNAYRLIVIAKPASLAQVIGSSQ